LAARFSQQQIIDHARSAAIAIGQCWFCHRRPQRATGQHGARCRNNSRRIAPHQRGIAAEQPLAPLRGVAHHQAGQADSRCLFLNPTRIGQHKATLPHQSNEPGIGQRRQQVDAGMTTQSGPHGA